MRLNDFKLAAYKAAVNAKKRDANVRRRKIQQQREESAQKHALGKRAALQHPYLEIPPEMMLTRDYLSGVAGKRRYNVTYADYFDFLAQDQGDPKFIRIADSVRNCHKHWYGEYYNMQQVFDVQNVLLCHSKFCSNCEHLKQASRLKRFTPVLAELTHDYDFYHLSVTVPNCPDFLLKTTIDKLLDAFTQLMRYFSGDAKLRGVDMRQYGYGGAVRCLECTVPADFHPHIHALLLLKKDLPLYKTESNPYSYDRGVFKENFSTLEIFIQKVVFLICNGQKVTKQAIEALPLGYSCKMNKVDGEDWKEVFKYVTKLTKDESDDSAVLTYEQFKTLYFALFKRKVMQGYGILYKVAKNDEIDDEIEAMYYKIVETLRLVENPIETGYAIDELLVALMTGRITCISKRTVQQYLNELAERERQKRNLQSLNES